MPVGTLKVGIALDHPGKVHCGSTEPVTGKISLRFTPSGNLSSSTGSQELFGPLHIYLSFTGRAKTKVSKSNGQQRQVYRGRAPLFLLVSGVHHGPFRAAAKQTYQFPFAIEFPTGAQMVATQGSWIPDTRYRDQPGDPLPPSFATVYAGFVHRFDAFVEYRIGAKATMEQIDVKIEQVKEDAWPVVLYEKPRVHPAGVLRRVFDSRQKIAVSNEYLLPESDRPKGFKEKTRALFTSDYYPRYEFDVLYSGPSDVYVGSGMAFEVAVRPNMQESTAVVVPQIAMGSFNVAIEATTDVRAERGMLMTPEATGMETVYTLLGEVDDPNPFSKSNDWKKTINTDAIVGVPSTFSTYNIVRRYRLRVRFSITAANKTSWIDKGFPIVIHPPIATPSDGQTDDHAVASSSTTATTQLPAYEAPPEYDEAPGYDEATSPPVQDDAFAGMFRGRFDSVTSSEDVDGRLGAGEDDALSDTDAISGNVRNMSIG